jgi:hypothetical protein
MPEGRVLWHVFLFRPKYNRQSAGELVMKKVEYSQALTLKLSQPQRETIEQLARRQETSLAQAARFIMEAGLRTLDLKV